jgi:hypothetical protein
MGKAMTSAQLKSLEDLHNYAQSLAGKRPEDDPKLQKLQKAKQVVWLFLLVCTFLGYYLLDKMGEALALL